MQTLSKEIIDVKELNLWYSRNQALKNVSLMIDEKEITSIIGPSGCGKSTFLKTLNLMVKRIPDVQMSGEITYREKNLVTDKPNLVDLRKEIGMIFQKPNAFPQSIYDNIAFGPKLSGVRKKQDLDAIVEDNLKKVTLWDEVKDRLKENALSLSGGQQQRICIARSLATKPSILLMDEPTSALDPISTSKIEQLIVDLKEKYTIVIVTHNMQQAARISDTTAFLLNGEVVEINDTNKIFSTPKRKTTEDYISGQFG